MYNIRCDKCGWQECIDSIIYTCCPNCHHPLIIDDYNEDMDEDIAEELEKREQGCLIDDKYISDEDIIKEELADFGDKWTWEEIENVPDIRRRIKQRKIFIKLGGKIPIGQSIKI